MAGSPQSSPGDDEVLRRLRAAAVGFRAALAGEDGTALPVGQPGAPGELDALAALVTRAEAAVAAALDLEEAQRLSLTDGLTGLWNRRHLDLQLESELPRAVRFHEPFSLLFCDIDDFKSINDRHGHPTGDEVLVELGRRLMAATRKVDVVTRYGGDEFTLLLPRTGLTGARRLAGKVCAAIRAAPVDTAGGPVPVTISIGVATFPDHAASPRDLLAHADAALYLAKADGGDRVEHVRCQP